MSWVTFREKVTQWKYHVFPFRSWGALIKMLQEPQEVKRNGKKGVCNESIATASQLQSTNKRESPGHVSPQVVLDQAVTGAHKPSQNNLYHTNLPESLGSTWIQVLYKNNSVK